MAGAGRKVFTRQILSSADVQDYLQDQVVMQYASAAARAAAIPAPSNGMHTYLLDRRVDEVYIGGAWECPHALGVIAEGQLNASSALVNTTTRTRVTGNINVTATLTAGRLYRAEWMCGLITDAASTAIGATLSCRPGTGTPATSDTQVSSARGLPAATGTAGAISVGVTGPLFTVAATGTHTVSPWLARITGAGQVQSIVQEATGMQTVHIRDEGLLSRRDWLQTVNDSVVTVIS